MQRLPGETFEQYRARRASRDRAFSLAERPRMIRPTGAELDRHGVALPYRRYAKGMTRKAWRSLPRSQQPAAIRAP